MEQDEPTRVALYSVVLGRYEERNQQPEIAERLEPWVEPILLTDDVEATSEFWRVVVVEPALPDDPVRSQRLLKILGHPVLDAFDATIYVDNAVTLLATPGELMDAWLGEHEMALPAHSYRETVLDEFDEVVRLQYDEPSRIYEQLLAYGRQHPEVLDLRPWWTAILLRRRTPRVQRAMRTWADHVLRYSRRDQLSAGVAFAGLEDVLATVEVDNMTSPLHRWPTDLGRRVAAGKALEPQAGPLLAEIRRRDRALAAAREERDAAQSALAAVADERDRLGAAGAQLRETSERLQRELDAAHAHVGELRGRVESVRTDYERSTSWRLTAPLRRLRRR